MKHKILHNQSIIDFAITHSGDVSAYLQLLIENGYTDLNTNTGDELEVSEISILKKKVVSHLASLNASPAGLGTITSIPNPTAPALPAYVDLNGQFTLQISSGATTPISIVSSIGYQLQLTDNGNNEYEVPNGAIHITNEDNVPIATFPITPGVTEPYTAPSGDVEINGNVETDVLAGGLTKVNVKDQDGNQLNPTITSAGGRDVDLEVNVGGSSGWVRNPDWLQIPTLTDQDNEFYGLLAVFEDEENTVVITTNEVASVVDWGDGSSDTGSTGKYVKTYDYSTLLGAVHQLRGRNYKQVIIHVADPKNLLLDNDGGASVTYSPMGFLDIEVSTPLGKFSSHPRKNIYLERLAYRAFDTGAVSSFTNVFNELVSLQNLIFPFDSNIAYSYTSAFQNSFNRIELGDISIKASSVGGMLYYTSIESIGNITIDAQNQSTGSLFRYTSYLRKVGDITITNTSNAWDLFRDNRTIEEIGDIYINSNPGHYNFSNCYRLHTIKSIEFVNATSMQSCFSNCKALQRIIMVGDLSTVTNAFNTFAGTYNLTEVILPELTVGFAITNAKLSAAALDALFTSIGLANGAQEITITGNPGAATCDTTIATNKGYTVII